MAKIPILLLLATLWLHAGETTSVETPKEHVESINGSNHTYTLTLGGVADAASMRNHIGYAAPIQYFEPMRSIRLENIGERDVLNPWITVNGKRNWRTAKDILSEALKSYGDPQKMTDAEKARAILGISETS